MAPMLTLANGRKYLPLLMDGKNNPYFPIIAFSHPRYLRQFQSTNELLSAFNHSISLIIPESHTICSMKFPKDSSISFIIIIYLFTLLFFGDSLMITLLRIVFPMLNYSSSTSEFLILRINGSTLLSMF